MSIQRTDKAVVLEICVDDAAGLQAAIDGGADRIELCAALSVGGLTPSSGFMELAGRAAIPVNALIRPRAGGFHYSAAEIDIIKRDIDVARQAGLAGVVIGASLADGQLDEETLTALVTAADGLDLTLHRAFDLVPDPLAALEMAVRLGFGRILTSGGGKSALAGLSTLAALAGAADGRISIMPGGGVRPETVEALLAVEGIFELHSSGGRPVNGVQPRLLELGFVDAGSRQTDRDTVRAFRAEIARVTSAR